VIGCVLFTTPALLMLLSLLLVSGTFWSIIAPVSVEIGDWRFALLALALPTSRSACDVACGKPSQCWVIRRKRYLLLLNCF